MESISDAKAFGHLVRRRRKALGLRQKELALAVGVGERMVVDLEAGKETCQLGKALAIARAVGILLADTSPASIGELSPFGSPNPDDDYDLPDMDGDR